MTEILIALAVVALVLYGLERNHRRQTRLGSHLAGSTDAEDRDVPRIQRELHATAVHTTPVITLRRSARRTWHRSPRPASQPWPRL